MPTIEDTFKSCIADYFNKTKATDTPQPMPLEPNAAVQPPTLLYEITGGSHVQSTSIGNQDCLVDSTPPQTLSALSLTLRVDQKTLAKIQSDEYVKFSLLLKKTTQTMKRAIKLWRKMDNSFFKRHKIKPKSLQFINGLNAFMFLWQFMPKNIQKKYQILWRMDK